MKSILLLLILSILLFVLPIFLEIYNSHLNILAVTWILFSDFELSAWSIYTQQFSSWGIGLIWSFFRFVFIIQIGRYFTGKTTKTRTLVLGLLAELQLTIPYYAAMLYSIIPQEPTPDAFIIPIPLFLIIGWLFMRLNSPERTKRPPPSLEDEF
jgi:hypothetical protein